MDLGLERRTALVLGGGGGLGSAISTVLAGEGAAVAVADIRPEAAARAAAAIVDAGGGALPLEWNLADLDVIPDRIARVEAELGPIDILVAITGGPPPTKVSGQDPATWREHFDSMVLAVIAVADALLPGMRARGWGRIVTSTSSGVIAPIPNLGISNALRLSLVGWSKTLAGEVGRDGVTANVVLPGRVATERITFLDEQRARRERRSVEEVATASASSIPVGRYGDPREYADVVAFLASERAAYVTGATIRVDGGLIPSI